MSWFSRAWHRMRHIVPIHQRVMRRILGRPWPARDVYLREQADLTYMLHETIRLCQARLRSCADAVASMSAHGRKEHLSALQEEQRALRRVLRRMMVAHRDTQSLLDEWREWQALGERSDGLHPEQQEHQEMLRSELAIRHVSLAKMRHVFDQSMVKPSAASHESSISNIDCYDEAGLMAWDDRMAPFRLGDVERLTHRLQHALTEQDDSTTLVEHARALKHAHAELKRQDRRSGVRRTLESNKS